MIELKHSRIPLTIMCLLVILSLLKFGNTAKASPKIIEVPNDYGTIQAAINNADSGDTIFVHSGTYLENIVVSKPVSLIGEDRNSTIVNGGFSRNVINVTANNVVIEGFTIKYSGTNAQDSGIFVENRNHVVVRGNMLTGNNNGISLSICTDNTISNNMILSNDNYGVYLYSSANNIVSNNDISGNDNGVSLFYSAGNTVFANFASENLYGLFLLSSINNVVAANNISSNGFGLYFLVSGNNTVYHNNIDDIVQGSSDSVNFWNYTGEGNFWRNYAGQDQSGDGIGDETYVIDERNRDYCPLMGAFSDFPVILKGNVYHASIISNSSISDFEFTFGTETGNKIIRFNATDTEDAGGFCRVSIPTELMSYPYVLLVSNEEIAPTLLNTPNEAHACLYITYTRQLQTITIISSEALHLYNQLLSDYRELQADFQNLSIAYQDLLTGFQNLSITYNDLLNSYAALSASYSLLQRDFDEMNASSYQSFNDLNMTYQGLLSNYSTLQTELDSLNTTYYGLLDSFSILSGNYSQLQENLGELNMSYQNLYGLNITYYSLSKNFTMLTNDYAKLQAKFDELNESYPNLLSINATYNDLLNNLDILSSKYGLLQENYQVLNASYQIHVLRYSESIRNIQSLIYIFAATTAIFIITTIYLSKRAHTAGIRTKTKTNEDTK